VIVHLHGNAENRSTHMYFVAWMTEADFDVVVFDYRGYGDSDGFASRASTVEDAGAIIKWVRENPRFKGLPLIAVGQSLGGAVAIPAISWYARQDPPQNPVDGLILDSTFSSYRRVARQKLDSVWLTWPLQWPLSFLVSDELSPESHAADVSIPVLSFHSERDRVVPAEFGRELFQALASKEKRFVEIPVPGHTVAFAVESDEYRTMAVDFVNRIARQKSSEIRSTSQP
jgi:alpha-beta hydrolase superfamily lysophospholipase